MPAIDEISYSREETVEAVRGFHLLLVSMYMNESLLQEPLETGWPNIAPHGWRNYDKTPEVIDLLRYLPYIREDGWGEKDLVVPRSNFVDYSTTPPAQTVKTLKNPRNHSPTKSTFLHTSSA